MERRRRSSRGEPGQAGGTREGGGDAPRVAMAMPTATIGGSTVTPPAGGKHESAGQAAVLCLCRCKWRPWPQSRCMCMAAPDKPGASLTCVEVGGRGRVGRLEAAQCMPGCTAQAGGLGHEAWDFVMSCRARAAGRFGWDGASG